MVLMEVISEQLLIRKSRSELLLPVIRFPFPDHFARSQYRKERHYISISIFISLLLIPLIILVGAKDLLLTCGFIKQVLE